MKNIFLCCACAAFFSSSPAFAADEPAAQPQSVVSSSGADVRRLVGEIDLRVLLQHYEKLKTEIQQTKLQIALQDAGAVDPATPDAVKEFTAKQYDKNVTPEEKLVARKRYEESVIRESARLRDRLQVLENLANATCKEAEALAADLAGRASAKSHPTSFEPRS